MSSFSYSIPSKYSFDTYDDVIKTYEWLIESVKVVFTNINDFKIRERFKFSTNNMSCECDSVDEFRQLSLGLDIKPKDLSISVRRNEFLSDPLVFLFVVYSTLDKEAEICINSDDKKYIAFFNDVLRNYSLNAQAEKQPILVQPIDSKDGIQPRENDTKIIHISASKEKWYTKILWQILVPIAVVIIGTALCYFLGIL